MVADKDQLYLLTRTRNDLQPVRQTIQIQMRHQPSPFIRQDQRPQRGPAIAHTTGGCLIVTEVILPRGSSG